MTQEQQLIVEPDRIQSASTMADAFRSVGVGVFSVTVTDELSKTGYKLTRAYLPRLTFDRLTHQMPAMLVKCERERFNLIVRPIPSCAERRLVQLDDLSLDSAELVKQHSFLVLQTSPSNYQAWLALDDANDDTRPRLIERLSADRGANGAVRVAGSRNYKPKYAPDFPVVTLVAIQPGLRTDISHLESAELLAPAAERERIPPHASPLSFPNLQPTKWPDYGRFLRSVKSESEADFRWCLAAMDWGHHPARVKAMLPATSPHAKRDGLRYVGRTVAAALKALSRRRGV